jgi:hypothetical protein
MKLRLFWIAICFSTFGCILLSSRFAPFYVIVCGLEARKAVSRIWFSRSWMSSEEFGDMNGDYLPMVCLL